MTFCAEQLSFEMSSAIQSVIGGVEESCEIREGLCAPVMAPLMLPPLILPEPLRFPLRLPLAAIKNASRGFTDAAVAEFPLIPADDTLSGVLLLLPLL